MARAYGATNTEEAQAVLLGELSNSGRFIGRLDAAREADLTALKSQTALRMARLHVARPTSYEYYRLMADVARVRAVIRARLTPLETQAVQITQDSQTIYTPTDPEVVAIQRNGMTRLKSLEDLATSALTGLPPYPTSAMNETRH